MARVKVSELAALVGTPVDRLLQQMKQAGLSHTEADQPVSDKDKQTLLLFLKGSHGESSAAPKKITLKRKTLSVIKSSSSQGKKTISVEVRKKRTYVKRDSLIEEAKTSIAEDEQVDQRSSKVSDVEPSGMDELSTQQASEPQDTDILSTDPEILRQQAAARQKVKESAEREQIAKLSADKNKNAAATKAGMPSVDQAQQVQKEDTLVKDRYRSAAESGQDTDERKKKKVKSLGIKKRGKDRGRNLKDIDTLITGEDNESLARRKKSKVLKLPKGAKMHRFAAPTDKIVHEVSIPESITVASLAQKMSIKANVVVKELMKLGMAVSINENLDQETAQLVVEELGHRVILDSGDGIEEALAIMVAEREGTLAPRAPVITVMGHVDHGKTSLLDYIRNSRVASGEFGGITQHIGAYHVKTSHGDITFLDTPGHSAFTAMRARGAKSTDVVILVVAADDGVMPQTEEAIQHARAAEVPIIVAVNKVDKEESDPDRIRNELSSKGVIPDDWGGDVQFVNVSAHTGEGIDELLDAVLLQAELLELKALVDVPGHGLVLESRLDKDRGSVASLLVQAGRLEVGDVVLAGRFYGRVRAMNDENQRPITKVGPSMPVEMLGLNGTPDAGDPFVVVDSEKRARDAAEFRLVKANEIAFRHQQVTKLDDVFANMNAKAKQQSLNIVIKADVRGSLEALQAALREVGNEEVSVNIVVAGVGGITETDANLALTSQAVIFGFNVRADSTARKIIEKEHLDLRYYSVIYDLIDDVKRALSGMLSPELREQINGVAEVRDVFQSPKLGAIAGCMVIEGTILRNNPIRVLRDNVVIYEGELESLRRFKDDVNEVRNGLECGIGVKNYNDVRPGDRIEVYEVKEIARSL